MFQKLFFLALVLMGIKNLMAEPQNNNSIDNSYALSKITNPQLARPYVAPILGMGITQISASYSVGYSSSYDSRTFYFNPTNPGVGLTLGVLGGFPVARKCSFETGLFLSRRVVSLRANKESLGASYLEVPLNARYQINRYFSFGVGFYGAFPVSDISSTLNGETTTQKLSDYGIRSFDFGLQVDARLMAPMTENFGLLLNVNFLTSILDLYERNSFVSLRYNIFRLLGGVQFFF